MRFARGDAAPLIGVATVPPDKSISHRALMLASMADGVSRLENLLDSQDVRSTLGAMRALGASIEVTRRASGSFDAVVEGWGEKGPAQPTGPIDCGNSGTTARLLMGIIAGAGVRTELVGDASLSRRPMERIADPLSMMGASFADGDGTLWEGGPITLPLTVAGSGDVRPIAYRPKEASAQVKTAILLAGLGCDGGSRTTVIEPSGSRDHTERMLPAFGVPVTLDGLEVSIEGGQRLRPCDLRVPGDPSSAMFMVAAAAMTPGSDLLVPGVGFNPTRTGGFEMAIRMGCGIRVSRGRDCGREPVCDLRVLYSEGLVATEVEPAEIPFLIDEVPVLALLATHAEGRTVFRSVQELRVKESDRLAEIASGLVALGCRAEESGDDLIVSCGLPRLDADLDSKGDHRLAMTWVLANRCHGLGGSVRGTSCMDVSYPGFVEELDELQEGSGGE